MGTNLIKHPDLYYNHYYPFYTQDFRGRKTRWHQYTTIMHISDEIGIRIVLEYEKKKAKAIKLDRLSGRHDRKELYTAKVDYSHIAYPEFAKIIRMTFNEFRKALHTLAPEKAYYKTIGLTSAFKFNKHIELEIAYRRITVDYGEFNYSIIEGKIVKEKEQRYWDDDETNTIMRNVDMVLDTYDKHTSYKEITQEKFKEDFNWQWESFLKYFTSPKHIRKKEYSPAK